MKICPNCNAQLEDDAVFCNSCGIAQPQSESVMSQQNPQSTQNAPYDSEHNNVVVPDLCVKSPIMEETKKIASSSTYLVMSVMFCLSQVLSFVGAFIGIENIKLILSAFSNGTNDAALENIFDKISFSGGGNISILGILAAVALWMIYAAAKTPNQRMNTTGLKILKVIAIIQLVLVCIATGLIAIAALFVGILLAASGISLFWLNDVTRELMNEFSEDYIRSYDYENDIAALSSAIVVVLIIVLITIVAICAFSIIYRAFVIKTLNSAINTVKGNMPSVSGYGFVSVILIISGVFDILGGISLSVVSYLTGFTSIISGVATLLAGLLLLKLKKAVTPFTIPDYMQYYNSESVENPLNQ